MLVTEAELRELISQMEVTTAQPEMRERELALRPTQGAEPAIVCPRCTTRMTKHDLYGMLVDRCEAHGIWFDRSELETALANAGEEASKMPLGSKIALTAVTVGYLAFHIASFLLRTGSVR